MNLFRLGNAFYNLDALTFFDYSEETKEVELVPTQGDDWGKAVRVTTRQANLRFSCGKTLELRGKDADRFKAIMRVEMNEAS